MLLPRGSPAREHRPAGVRHTVHAPAARSLESSGAWKVSANSTLTTLSDAAGISGGSAALGANSALGGRSYTLAGAGALKPSR